MLLKVLIVQGMAMTHTIFACGSNSNYSIVEMLLRVVLYYVITAVVILSGPYLAGADKTHYRVSVPLVCAQLLFVHIFSLLANISVFVAVHMRIVCAGLKSTEKMDEEKAVPRVSPSSITQAMHDTSDTGEQKQLLAMLLAAKKEHNVA